MAVISYQLRDSLKKNHNHNPTQTQNTIYLFILQIPATGHAENVSYGAGAETGVALVLKKNQIKAQEKQLVRAGSAPRAICCTELTKYDKLAILK